MYFISIHIFLDIRKPTSYRYVLNRIVTKAMKKFNNIVNSYFEIVFFADSNYMH